MLLTLDHIDTHTSQIHTFWFSSERPVDYVAGQFTQIQIEHKKPDSRGIVRWFTLSSSPSELLLSITTRKTQDGSSFKRALFGLKPGDTVTMSEPLGDFVLPKDSSIPLVFIAAGMGITPVRSIVKWLQDTHERRPIKVIHSVSKQEDAIFHELFANYALESRIHITGSTTTKNHITGATILASAYNDDRQHIYISGPEKMVEELEKQLLDLGFPSHQLILDFFPGY